MPTGQDIVSAALTTLGMLEQGGTPSVSDSVDSLAELNAMWDAWGIDEGLIYAILTQRFQLAANIAFYTIGPGGGFSTTRAPARIYRATVASVTGGAIATQAISTGGSPALRGARV